MTGSTAEATTTQRPALIAIVAGVVLAAIAAHRQAERDALRLGNRPVAEAAPLPRTMPIPRKPLDDPRRPTPTTPTAPPEPPRSSPSALAPDHLERLGVEAFAEARPGLLECLRAERDARPAVSGKLPITVDIDANGLVSAVALGESPVRSAPFDECATLVAAGLVFPAELADRDVAITFDLR